MPATRPLGPERRGPPGRTTAAAVRFAGELRGAGLRADVGAVVGFARALTVVDLARPGDVHAAGASLFVRRPEERPIYDAVFRRFWLLDRPGRDRPEESHGAGEAERASADRGNARSWGEGSAAGHEETRSERLGESDHERAEAGDRSTASALAYSPQERLRGKSFDEMTPDELHDAARLIAHLRPRLARRRTRRYRLHHRGRLLAPRPMMRRSLGTGGDQLDWLWRRRRTRPRPIVAICDISGSMEQHSRLALRFVHALTRIDVRTEAFVFGTRLTRVTSQLRHRQPEEALRAVAGAVHDWSGGTQIGRALHEFNRRWGPRVLHSSTIAIIVSDGWDRGDPAVVAHEMEQLRRRCHRVVWLNPLASTTGYEPRTAGMAAAYPFIDHFLGFRSVESLERLGQLLGLGGVSTRAT